MNNELRSAEAIAPSVQDHPFRRFMRRQVMDGTVSTGVGVGAYVAAKAAEFDTPLAVLGAATLATLAYVGIKYTRLGRSIQNTPVPQPTPPHAPQRLL